MNRAIADSDCDRHVKAELAKNLAKAQSLANVTNLSEFNEAAGSNQINAIWR